MRRWRIVGRCGPWKDELDWLFAANCGPSVSSAQSGRSGAVAPRSSIRTINRRRTHGSVCNHLAEMTHPSPFNLELLQAVSDWQRGGDAKQKKKRGAALKAAAISLPDSFKSSAICYRQIALDKSAVWRVGTNLNLSETISAWTQSLEAAKSIKGGVPPVGYQGVIFRIEPTPDQIVVNLASLYEDKIFRSSLEEMKAQISGYWDGAGKYGATQVEVVLDVASLPLDSIHSWGGYSSPELQLAAMFFGHTPSQTELHLFRELMEKAGHRCGPYWLSTPDAVSRVAEKLKFHAERLSNSG